MNYERQWRRIKTILLGNAQRLASASLENRPADEDVLAGQCAEGEARLAFNEAMELWAGRTERCPSG